MCLYPKLIKNKKYVKNKKNGGVIPPVNDERVLWVPVGCQRCIECRKQKARGWQVRMLEDIKTNRNGVFITLTLSNESIKKIVEQCELQNIEGYELDNEIATRATRMFLERWRKKHKKSLRHWLVTELGHDGTENIHLHGIIWTDEKWENIEKTWGYGFIWKGQYVNEKTVNYIVKYIHKVDEKHKEYNSKILTSAGIGSNYTNTKDAKINSYKGEETIETYRTRQGFKVAMPTYWRNKTYSEEEREKLWLIKLDKNERWVCGEKVKADDTEQYYKLLEWHRRRNKVLGYGDDKKRWDREVYENERRKIMMARRIENNNKKKKK